MVTSDVTLDNANHLIIVIPAGHESALASDQLHDRTSHSSGEQRIATMLV
jgi:hypothetical protein